MKVLIIGGVAGGASAAARLRRLDENVEIIMFERGGHISFANCGLPYYIGGTIKERQKLLVQTPEGMIARFNIDVRVNSEVVKISPTSKTVDVLDTESGKKYSENYDYLILSPGAEPAKPPIPGINLPNIFTLRSMEDTDRITNHLRHLEVGKVLVVGGGFVGIEMAENLKKAGLEVTLVEASNQLMPPLDPEMAGFIGQHLASHGIVVRMNNAVTAFEGSDDIINVLLTDGTEIKANAVIMAIGVKPDSSLASEAGLDLGQKGAVRVNEYLQTSDPYIYAVGDVIEVKDFVNGTPEYVPLAGPANRQGRLAADNIAGRRKTYRGTQGTSIVKIFDMVAASTGNNEKTLQNLGITYQKSYTYTASHAGYYPGAVPMNLKLLFNDSGEIYGAQIVGVKGVDKRIDVLAAVIHAGLTVYDLEELELAYAPPFSSAKDPVNMAGFVAANILKGDVEVIHWDHLSEPIDLDIFFIDVRQKEEFIKGHLKGAVNIPLDQLRGRIDEVPRDKRVILYCQSGLRSYVACRILMQKGYKPLNLSGGYHLYSAAWRK